MKSGGAITWDPGRIDRTAYDDQTLNPEEIKQGLPESSRAGLTDDTLVQFNGKIYKWQDLQQAINEAGSWHGPFQPGQNLSPEDVQNQINALGIRPALDSLLQEMETKAAEIQNAQRNVEEAQQAVTNARNAAERRTAQATLNTRLGELRVLKAALQTMVANARNMGATESQVRPYSQLLGETAREDGGGTGSFSASSGGRGMTLPGGQPGPAGTNGQGGARGAGLPGGGGYGGYGDPLFAGFQPPTSAAYGAALFMDAEISDGLGQIGQSRREGQKMMMLFFYFARMAESGDPFAMYNFIKFITFIIAKDKARQNIQIGSKLIQLQDMSRKATEALMAAPSDDPNKSNEFLKAMQEARSQETSISTSQKLLADMLQEYAGVTEGLINSTKNLQEFWFRATRTASRQA